MLQLVYSVSICQDEHFDTAFDDGIILTRMSL